MSEEILTEQEMSDLTGSHDSQAGNKEELSNIGQITPYNFKQPEHTRESHFPTLQIINERMAIDLRDKLELMLQKSVDVEALDIKINSYGEYLHSLAIPIDIKRVNVPELNGNLFLCFDSLIINSLIEAYFGAPELCDKENKEEDKEEDNNSNKLEREVFTNAELRISDKLMKYVLDSMKTSWKLLDEFNFNYINSESNPRLMNDMDTDELIVSLSFKVNLQEKENMIRIAIPYKTLDKVKHNLRRVVQNIQEAGDKQWVNKFYKKLQCMPVTLIGELGRTVMPVSKLVDLKIGDTFTIQKPESITVYIDKTPILNGQLGESNGQTAIKVNHWIKSEKR